MRASSHPVIGVTAYDEKAAWGLWHKQAALVPGEYVRSLTAAGAMAVIIPAQGTTDPACLDDLVLRLDGLVLAGGPDLDPARYGADPHPLSQPPRRERDERELALLASAERSGLPVLAVCRGMQLLNVARGGTIIQHLPEVVGHDEHNPTPGAFSGHLVRTEASSRLREMLGWQERSVPTHHHQAVDQLGRGLSAVAWASDGTVEAVEDTSKSFLVGVQWHAEADDDIALFEALVRAASSWSTARCDSEPRRQP